MNLQRIKETAKLTTQKQNEKAKQPCISEVPYTFLIPRKIYRRDIEASTASKTK